MKFRGPSPAPATEVQWAPLQGFLGLFLGKPRKFLGSLSFQGSFQGDIDIGVGVDANKDIDSDMAVSMDWGDPSKGFRAPQKGFGLI